jgi:hypothetical protein
MLHHAPAGVWDRADSSGSSRCTHSVPCIHSLRITHSFTADPWTEWHRTDMTMHLGEMPGDKTKRAYRATPKQPGRGGGLIFNRTSALLRRASCVVRALRPKSRRPEKVGTPERSAECRQRRAWRYPPPSQPASQGGTRDTTSHLREQVSVEGIC